MKKTVEAKANQTSVENNNVSQSKETVTSNEIKARIYLRPSKDEVLYARVIAPKQLREHIQKAAIWRSLKVKELTEALRTAAAISLGAQQLFQEIANQHLSDLKYNVVMSNEIDADGFFEILAKVEADEITDHKEELRTSFFKEPVKRGSKKSDSGNGSGKDETPTVKTTAELEAEKNTQKAASKKNRRQRLNQRNPLNYHRRNTRNARRVPA